MSVDTDTAMGIYLSHKGQTLSITGHNIRLTIKNNMQISMLREGEYIAEYKGLKAFGGNQLIPVEFATLSI